jgi:hypothetical protein
MSKKSRRRNKILLGAAALFGASKLGMLGGKGVGSSNVVGKTKEFRKSFAEPKKKFLKTAIGGKTKNKFPLLSVTETGDVIKKGVNTGVGNNETKFISRNVKNSGIFQKGKKISDLNSKAINVLSDGSIKTGGKTFAGKKEYRAFKDAERLKKRTNSMKKVSEGPSLFGFRFKNSLFKKGTMVKARGGGMARMKPTKLY